MARVIEADICIVGAGITGAMVAEKLSDEREAEILMVEGGSWSTPLQERFAARERRLDYRDNPWANDHIPGQKAPGINSPSMVVGGWAMHWGGTCPRFTPEDFALASRYGVGHDWPISYDDLESFYQEAEERIGVAGEQGPPELDVRSAAYPMPPVPLSWSLRRLKQWGESTGIPFWTNPVAKNSVPYDGRSVCQRCDTCEICPTGAKYSPDFTLKRLVDAGRIELITRMLVRRLVVANGSTRISHAVAVDRDSPEEEMELRARTFVLAAGYVWSPHLLLVSRSGRFPEGLANSSGLVGKYMTGHRPVSAYIELPMQLYPGEYARHSLLSKAFQRPMSQDRYVRHDLRIWESTVGREPRFRADDGRVLLGDEIMKEWRERVSGVSTARVRAYYDVLPHRESRVNLDPSLTNPWGDPLPRVEFRDAEVSVALREHTVSQIRGLFEKMARAGDGKILSFGVGDIQDHPGGGCRMGKDPSTSVTNSYGRTHDHENLFVVGAPTMVTGGCNNGTLTFAALSLRSTTEIGRDFPVRDAD